MSIKRYVPASILFLLTAGETYLTYGFISSNSRVPEGTVFTINTLGPSFSATILALTAFIGVIPGVKTRLQDQGLSNRAYWLAVSSVMLLSVLLAVAAVLSGSVEYTQFQASAS